MGKSEELRSCPRCGSENFTYLEVNDSYDGDELYDVLRCDECGCEYRLVFRFVKIVEGVLE